MEAKKKRKNYFVTGLVAILPLTLSVYIIVLIFSYIGSVTSPLFRKIFELANIEYTTFIANLVSVVITFALIWFIGVLVTNIFGRRLFLKFESVLVRLPIIKGIYASIRQFLTYFMNDMANFQHVVLVQYPRKGIYSIGFVTGDAKGYVQDSTPEHVVNVFMPTTPNPTSGMFVLVPKEDLIELKISVDDAVRLVISAGIITPKTVNKQNDFTGENK